MSTENENTTQKMIMESVDVWKSFGHNGKEIVALQEISFQIHSGEFVCIVGPSGCGKSTLLRILDGLEPPTKGEVLYRDKKVTAPDPKIGVIFQTFALIPWKTVLENVEMGLLATGKTRERAQQTAKTFIHDVGLEGFEESYPRELSGGMKQRVGIARALALEPEVLLMDEPFSSLDALTAENLRRETLEMWARPDIPVNVCVMVTHNVQEAVYMADRVLVLSARPGRIVGDVRVNLQRPRNSRDPELFNYADTIVSMIS